MFSAVQTLLISTNRHQQALTRLAVAHNADNGSNGSHTMAGHVAAFNQAQATTVLTRSNHSPPRFGHAFLRALIPREVSCRAQRDGQIYLKVVWGLKLLHDLSIIGGVSSTDTVGKEVQ